MNYWLVKTEPNDFSIDDLKSRRKEPWTGVRNYQARNNLRAMEVGDLVLIYHSSADLVGIAGVGEVLKARLPDPTQFDKTSKYYDLKRTKEYPRWVAPIIGFQEKFSEIIPLKILRSEKKLAGLETLRTGSRLSVQPVKKEHYNYIIKLAQKQVKKP